MSDTEAVSVLSVTGSALICVDPCVGTICALELFGYPVSDSPFIFLDAWTDA